MRKIILILIGFLLNISLAADVEVIENLLQTKVSKQELKLEHSYNLSEDVDEITDFIVTNDRIYFANIQAKTVTILDLEGKIVRILDQTGRGPGEFSMPSIVFDDTQNNCFCVVDQMNQRTSYFSYDGDYIEDILFKEMRIPMRVSYIGNKKIFYFMGIELDRERGSILSKPTIQLVEEDEKKTTLYINSFNPLQMSISQSKIPVYINSEKNIFITELNSEDYKIEVFNEKGEHIKDITKKFKKVKKSESDIEEIENRLEEVKKQIKASGAEINMDFSGYEFENAISAMLIGPKGNLWVQTVDKDGILFDIIGNEGKIIRQYRGKEDKFGICKFYNDKMYEITGNEDDGFVLNVYTLKD